jgi:hypothetical protein
MSDVRNGGTGMIEAEPPLLNSLLLRCSHCHTWSPSPMRFWYFEGFERARARRLANRCPACFKATASHEQRYRAFLQDGQVLEG